MRQILILAIAAFGLGACTVAPPRGPSVVSLPPKGKDFARFQQEDAICQQQASASLGLNNEQAAAQAGIGSAALGTALGAAAGGLIGAATGNFGAGAAIGAGTGLLAGSAMGVGAAANTNFSLQERFDITYSQCMAAYGNTIQPMRVSVPVPVYVNPRPYFGPSVGFGHGWGHGWGHGRPFGGYYRRW